MADEAQVGAGDVPITLDGKDYALVPTVAAFKNISKAFGGLRAAATAVTTLDVDIITRIVQFGLGPQVVKELGGADKLPDHIFAAGILDTSGGLASKCITFVTNLSNGGRPVPEEGAGTSTVDPPKPRDS